jgi:hypothetical protein
MNDTLMQAKLSEGKLLKKPSVIHNSCQRYFINFRGLFSPVSFGIFSLNLVVLLHEKRGKIYPKFKKFYKINTFYVIVFRDISKPYL